MEEKTKNYKNVNIKTISIEIAEEQLRVRQGIRDLFSEHANENIIEEWTTRILDACHETYMYAARFLRMMTALRNLSLYPEIRSYLVVTNAKFVGDYPDLESRNRRIYNMSQLERFIHFTMLCDLYDDMMESFGILEEYNSSLFLRLSTAHFEEEVKEAHRRLLDGKRVILFTPYQTAGTAVNMQSPLIPGMQIVRVHDVYESNEMDIGGIYLERRTNIFPSLQEYRNQKNLTKQEKKLFKQVMYDNVMKLCNLYDHYEISQSTLILAVDDIWNQYINSNYRTTRARHAAWKMIRETRSCKWAMIKHIVQALGRINRTPNKGQTILIQIDLDDAMRSLPFREFLRSEDVLLNPEMEAFAEEVCRHQTEDPRAEEREKEKIRGNRNDINCQRTDRKLNAVLRDMHSPDEDKREDAIRMWNAFRKFCIGIVGESIVDANETRQVDGVVFQLSNVLVKLRNSSSTFTYNQERDFKEISDIDNGKGRMIYGEEDSLLSEFVTHLNGFREFLEEQGAATSFTASSYALCPNLYQRVYLGYLGELAGSYILSHWLGMTLSEMPHEHYEEFDFIYHNVCIDFKRWKETNTFDSVDEQKHCYEKLQKVGAAKAIIINIAAKGNYPVVTSYDGAVVEIPMIYDLKTHSVNQNMLQEIVKHISEAEVLYAE